MPLSGSREAVSCDVMIKFLMMVDVKAILCSAGVKF